MRARIEIPAPLFVEGADCEVLNYRKQRETWERGLVERAPIYTLGNAGDERGGHWIYAVELDRRSGAGNRIHLSVTDDRIRACRA